MPKSCNSIYKNLCLFLLLPILFSCASNSLLTSKQQIYTGKFYADNSNFNSAFTTSIVKQGNVFIIQVSKPFFGNVLDFSVKRNGDVEATSSNNMFVNSDFTNVDYKKIYVWLNQCLDKEMLQENSGIKDSPDYLFIRDNSIRLVCSKDENETSFEIRGYEFQVNGYVKS
jgi:hypothetical protein